MYPDSSTKNATLCVKNEHKNRLYHPSNNKLWWWSLWGKRMRKNVFYVKNKTFGMQDIAIIAVINTTPTVWDTEIQKKNFTVMIVTS